MPLTPTERKNLAACKTGAVSITRWYVIYQRSRYCPAGHATGTVLDTPPTCGKCTVRLSRNSVQTAEIVAEAKQNARDYAVEQARKPLSDANLREYGVPSHKPQAELQRTANFQREGTSEMDQDEVVAAYAADLAVVVKERIDEDGKVTRVSEVVFANRADGDAQYLPDPLHRSDLTGWVDRVPQVYVDGEYLGAIETLSPMQYKCYWLNASHDACKYCRKTFYAEDFQQVPLAPEVQDQDVVVAMLTHYYECAMIRQFQRKAQREIDRGPNPTKEGVPTFVTLLAGSEGSRSVVEIR